MKRRQGFISNSSSTSFYINGSKYSKQLVEETIKDLLNIVNKINPEYQEDFDDCITIYEDVTLEDMKREFKSYHDVDKDMKYLIELLGKDNIIQVNSTYDNSIPYTIQAFLEDSFNAYRQHWG